MNTRISGLLLCMVLFVQFANAQSGVGIGIVTPNKNAVLELVSPGNNQGLMIPKMTTAQRTATTFTTALSAKENGLLVFDSDDNKFYFWQANQWQSIGGPGTNTDDQTLSYSPSTGQLTISALSGPTSVTITPAGAAGGDLTGTFPSPSLAANTVTTSTIVDGTITAADLSNLSIGDSKISGLSQSKITAGSNGQVLTTSGGAVVWSTPAGGSVTSIGTGAGLTGGPITSSGTISLSASGVTAGTYGTALSVPQITVDALGRITSATSVTVTGTTPGGSAGGDLNGNYPNPTINTNAVTSAKINDNSIVDADINTAAAIAVSKFSVGSAGQVLTTAGGVAQWANPSGSVLINNAGTRNLFAGEFVGAGSGTDNAFFGSSAGNANSTGNYNAIFGTGAGQNKTVGDLNTLIGWLAGRATGSTATFNGNTFVGAQAGLNATGGPNTFIGEKAGQFTTTGTQNVFVGNQTGLINTTGAQNTIIGYGANLSAAGLQNASAIGYNTVVDASNKVRIGNAAVTVIQGQVAYTNASDARLKQNVKALAQGLDFILKLKPVSYQMKNTTDLRQNWGFLAQDIEQLVGSDNAVLSVGSDKDRTLGLRYSDFIAPLVKAVQQQQNEIDEQKVALQKKDEQIKSLQIQLKSDASDIASIKDQLETIRKSLGL